MLPLLEDFEARRSAVGIYGLGFVGLHLASALASAYRLVGYDPDPLRRDILRAGYDSAGEISSERLKSIGLEVAESREALSACRIIVVAAPVPLGPEGKPNLAFLKAAVADVGLVLRPGTLVIFEAPVPAPLIESECAGILAARSGLSQGVDFHVACSMGVIGAINRAYRIADPLRCIVGDSTVTGMVARAFLAPCTDVVAPPATPAPGESRGPVSPPPMREMLVAAIVSLQVLILPWMIGGQTLTAQYTALALSVVAFLCLFIPDARSSLSERVGVVLKNLTRAVPFWLGLVLVVLFGFQAANTRLTVEFESAGSWVLIPKDYIAWLPSGIQAPFDLEGRPGGMNALRTMLIFGAPWLSFLALYCGVRSRRVLNALWVSLLVSAIAIALFVMGTRMSGSDWLFGASLGGKATPLGPFTYQNQGGAFLYLGFFCIVAFALRQWGRFDGRFFISGPQSLVFTASLVVLSAALMSNSFGVAVVLACSPLMLVPAFYWTDARTRQRSPGAVRRGIPALIAVAGLLALASVVIVLRSDFSGMVDKVYAKLEMTRTASLDDREKLREATRLMYGDSNRLFGAGGGSYRWLAPTYFEKFPVFCGKDGRVNSLAYYAHCDWLQALCEWGVVGALALLSGLIWFLVRIRRGLLKTPEVWPLLYGVAFFCLHAGWDYLFFNPVLSLMVSVLAFLLIVFVRAPKSE